MNLSDSVVIDSSRLQELLEALANRGHQVIGPTIEADAITYAPLSAASDLPRGYLDEQSGGHYRLRQADKGSGFEHSLFGYVVGPHSWKRYLFPPKQRLWRAIRGGDGFTVEAQQSAPRYAFVGVRGCESAAMRIQDRVFDNGQYVDSGYRQRRDDAFIVAVNCVRAGDTCFCASMGTGPQVRQDFDLCLTELIGAPGQRLLVQAGSQAGRELLEDVDHQAASEEDIECARALLQTAAQSMGREMPADAEQILKRNPEHPRWLEVGERCLSCANCTMVCPTCFCSTMEDTTSLDGAEAERWRRWDSCFTVDFSYIHGGPVRRETAARYRQWITHKLSGWVDQFGSSGCTGCGRCITWCPVGIDITEELTAIQQSETTHRKGDE